MHNASNTYTDALFLLTLGGILLLGLITAALGRQKFLPRVTLLIIFGVIIGKQGLDIIPAVFSERFDLITDMALLMIGFLLGGKLTRNSLRSSVNKVLWISLTAAVLTAFIVTFGLILIGVPLEIAILLGSLASATDPSAIMDVILESNYKGPFQKLLLSIVALDDAWALILFAFAVALVSSLTGLHADNSYILFALKDIGGAIILGIAIGIPSAFLTGRVKPGQPILSEALGIVFVCGGIALWFNVSFLIASMVLGAVIANFARHHDYPFHAIRGIERPFMIIFFISAGAALDLNAVSEVGMIGAAYIVCRIIGKICGAALGGRCSKADQKTKNWMGAALLPQAGVAIGMALVAANHFPEYRQILLTVVISSTVFFEIIGPVFTRLALERIKQS
ncbi:cation:proton antiporter [Psychromonas ossibalaenae]|uniref:cation:proton antiporter n=1 Tax=Psychromonas ossibalaenae TaxID=444922 RepID=UPI000380432D|nr:cation:proton antiporter [Psychromonas ossibalaenae]